MPHFSVVVATYNRAPLLTRTLSSVLDQSFADFEIVVVDDGSSDDTAEVVARFEDPRITYAAQPNQGAALARNAGAARATGEWLIFLDDDDAAREGWLEALSAFTAEPACGVACCGVEYVDPTGVRIMTEEPASMGVWFDGAYGLFLGGSFTVRRSAFLDAGGYAAGLACNHQTELALRLVPLCFARGLAVRHTRQPLITVFRRSAEDRPIRNPASLLEATLYIVEHHRERLLRSPRALAGFLSVAGVSAARLGRYREARHLLAQALLLSPGQAKAYARLSLAFVPPLADRLWQTHRYPARSAS